MNAFEECKGVSMGDRSAQLLGRTPRSGRLDS